MSATVSASARSANKACRSRLKPEEFLDSLIGRQVSPGTGTRSPARHTGRVSRHARAAHSPALRGPDTHLRRALDHGQAVTFRRGFGWIQAEEESSTPDVITVDEEDEESEFVRVRKRNWARLIAKVWKDDPEVCRECGSRLEMLSDFVARPLASQSSPAQDEVLERILRCRGQGHPPWERERPPRGPPKQLEMFSQERNEVPTWNPEDENQDPPGDGWME